MSKRHAIAKPELTQLKALRSKSDAPRKGLFLYGARSKLKCIASRTGDGAQIDVYAYRWVSIDLSSDECKALAEVLNGK